MPKDDMPDVIVLLPGISGSRLTKDGRVVWGFAPSALASIFLSGGDSLERGLLLREDPVEDDDLGDGVVADELIQDLHLIPGFWKIDGYTKVLETIKANFKVTPGENLFPFPYDWRRDNRVAARKLERSCNQWLKTWRAKSGNDKAKLILIAHSMGGLVARYFLESQQGWKDTRALITFGTPFRGSLNAVDTLANGLRMGPFGTFDFSKTARSFTSIYQLLPIYPCYDDGGGKLLRVGDIEGIPNVDAGRAGAALRFHREIEEAVMRNRNLGDFEHEGYKVYPIAGTEQSTSQSAVLNGVGVELLQSHDGKNYGGDGTVASVSAQPIEHTSGESSVFVATRHGSIQNADAVLTHIRGLIKSFYFDLGSFRGSAGALLSDLVRVDLQGPDLLTTDEPVMIQARSMREDVELEVKLTDGDGRHIATRTMTRSTHGMFRAEFPRQPANSYRVRVSSPAGGVEPAEDSFAVGNLAAAPA
ncbi:lipase/acyltransferase domain-containing protein [Mesorhizobium loti]|uniref:lipase/acyltransferase domain-containing protein n=1 Tax=Rhizobium loti TaxID=381 RepID=UPI0012685475|nr:hypothetical protein [Mesorhizobium loti]